MKAVEQEVLINKLSHDGRGITSIDGKCCFVAHALPNEKVRIEISHSKRKFSEAKLLEVLTPASTRVEPQCPHFTVCGGCALQHMSQDEQINLKQDTLLEQLQHFGQVQPKEILTPLKTEPYGYRRKARLGVRYVHKKEKLLMGFRERNGRYLADCETCAVIHPRIQAIWTDLQALLAGISIFRQIPQVECAVGDDAVALVIRHLEPFTDEDIAKIKTFGETHNIDCYLQPKGPKTVHKVYPEGTPDRISYSLPAFNVTLQAHPMDFMQVNADINRQMIIRAIELLDIQPTDTVLDLFCGLGNFTMPLATKAKAVVGVEGDAMMVERIMENAKGNQLENVVAFCADLSEDCSAMPWVKREYDKLLIDPARAGADKVIPLIKKLNPSRICYVSCNPATLARDAGLLVSQGYTLHSAGIMDMFTHTGHVEAMALFTRDGAMNG